MQRLMKVSFSCNQPLAGHIESSTREKKKKKKKTVMESINVVIDDAITNVANDDSGEGTNSKEAIVEIEAQGVEVE